MSNDDPILTAIQGGGVAVADDDPILSAIKNTPPASSASPKKSRAAAPKVSADQSDPILNAITKQDSLRTPTLDELTTGQIPETQTPSLTERASKLGRSMIPLTPPSVNMQSDYWTQEYAARQRDIEKINQAQQAQQEKAQQEQERQAEIAKQPFETRLMQSMLEPGTALGTVMRQQAPAEAAPQFESDYFKHRAAEATAKGKSVWDAFPHSITEALIRSMPANRNMPTEQARRIAAPMTQPLVDVPTAAGNTDQPFVAGAERAIGGFTSPENLALLGSLGTLEKAAQTGAGLVRYAPRVISGLFATQMGTGLVQSARQYQAFKAAGDEKGAQQVLGSALVQAPLTLLTAYHASVGRAGAPVRAEELLDTVHAADAAAAAHVSEAGAAPTRVGAGESLAPETPETLKAQTDALASGTNKVVYFPKGQGNLPEPPQNARVTVVPGEKQGAGTYYHSEDVTPEQIKAAVEDGSYGKLLGYTQSKEAAMQGKPAGVVARDANGTELKAGLVDSSNPQAVAEQAATFARQFPESKIGVETAESVIRSRQAPTPKPETSITEKPSSAQTQAPQIEAQPRTDAILDAIRGTAVAAPTQENLNFRQTKAAPLAQRFSPETLDEARQELIAAHQLASSFEQPGRYLAGYASQEEHMPSRSTNAAKGITAGGTWYGVGSSRHIVADQFPWYGEIEQGAGRLGKLIEKGTGAEYNRLLGTVAESIQREKASAAPIMDEFAPRLRELSDKIDGNDQDLSDALGQLANSDGRGFKNLRNYITEKVQDAERANSFFNAIDDAAAEAREASTAETPGYGDELRARESERTSAGAEATITRGAEGTEPAALPETSEAPSSESAKNLEQNALPGFESAIAEQKRGAARVQGERLGEEVNRPLGSIEQAAGEMERTSPLFRNTKANPQSDLFAPRAESKGLESAVPAVGDRIQPTTGPLKGQAVEVTKVGDTGVYGRAEDGAPIKFVKNGEFEAVRYSGIHPKALIEGARVLQRAWEEKIAQPFIDHVLKIGDKYRQAREADPAVAEGLHLLDNAPTYLRAKAAQVVKDVIGNLSRPQERLFTLMADADSRENLKLNHPEELRQAQNDPAVQEALRKYRPLERELTTLRERMGGQTLEQDYLRRVYDKYVAGVNKTQAPGTPERGTSAFDRVIRPQRTDKLSREATAEYHYENGLHEFGPAFATKFIATHLKALRDQVAREFLDKATMLPIGASEPRSIEYSGQRYWRPDIARELRDAGAKGVKAYDRYDPTAGEKFPVPADGKFLGPRDLVKTLTDFGRREEGEPGALRRFFQEQVIGFGFGVPHMANIMRRVSQTVSGGAVNPEGWARAWKVVLSKELRDRGISGLEDPTFDMLAKHGAISTGEVANLKAYMGGNLNPANWARALAQVGHKFLFEPTTAKGFGGLDQRARLYIADMIKSQRPELKDSEIAAAVRTQLGDYNRANWTDQQKSLSKFMLFPGWDFSSIRWVLQHPIKTTVPPALMVLLANRTLNYFGQNREEDRNDISNIHIGDRSYGTSLVRESVARNLFRPAIAFAQSKMRGESNQRAFDAASQGIRTGAGGLLSMLRPDLSGFLALATNRQNLASGKEIVGSKDYETPGKILPSKALEKQAVFTLRHALPALDRVLDSNEDVDLKSFAGGNLGVPNYRDDAEKRLIRNAAEANRVYQNVSKLAKTNPQQALEMLKDPDNAAYTLFHHDLNNATTVLRTIDQVRETVNASKISDAEKQRQLKALDDTRQESLANADGLNNLLFKSRTQLRQRGAIPTAPPSRLWSPIPLTPPSRATGVPFRPPTAVPQ
jgi:hypothetical protein